MFLSSVVYRWTCASLHARYRFLVDQTFVTFHTFPSGPEEQSYIVTQSYVCAGETSFKYSTDSPHQKSLICMHLKRLTLLPLLLFSVYHFSAVAIHIDILATLTTVHSTRYPSKLPLFRSNPRMPSVFLCFHRISRPLRNSTLYSVADKHFWLSGFLMDHASISKFKMTSIANLFKLVTP